MSTVSSTKAGTSFARTIGALATCRGDSLAAIEFLRGRSHWAEAAAIEKAAISAVTTADMDAALQPVAYDLAAYLRPRTLVGRLPLQPGPLRVRTLLQTAPLSARFVGEGQPAPFSAGAFTAAGILNPLKVSGGIVLTEELARSAVAGAVDLLVADATRALRYAMDSAFIDFTNSGLADVRPAAVTSPGNGATEIAMDAALTASGLDAAMTSALDSLTDAGCTLETARWICHPRLATRLATLRGDGDALAFPTVAANGSRSLAGIPLEVSAACLVPGSPSEYTLALIECSEILLADEGTLRFDTTTFASLVLDDAPAPGAAAHYSLWQNDLTALKVERFLNWAPRRAGAAAIITGISL